MRRVSPTRRIPYTTLFRSLAVGGVPSARSILRIAFPRFIRDSSQIIRGTLTLVPRMICDESRMKRGNAMRSEEHTSELQSHSDSVCRLRREKKKISKQLSY